MSETDFVAAAHLPLWMWEPVHEVTLALGLTEDQVVLMGCLIMAIPLGMVHKYSTSVTFKHWFSIIMGLAYGWLLVGPSVYHFVLLCVVCYGLISAFPTRPVLTLAVCMTHLSALQIHRLITNYLSFNLDVAMLMMIAVCKLTFMAYNVSDGVMIRNAVEFNKKKKGTSKNEKEEEDADVDKSCMLFEVHPQYKYRKSMALEELPSLVEYFSFCFFFPGILVGPCFEFKTYITFSEGSFVHLNTIKPALTKVGYAVCCYLVMAIGGYFPVSGVLDQPDFWNHPNIVWKLYYIFVSVGLTRAQYYLAWYLGEAGCVATGLGYQGTDEKGNHKWHGVTNCYSLSVETATTMPAITNNWNLGVNTWLKHYVYLRIPDVFQSRGANNNLKNVITKSLAAFWHGFYPGYYVFFVSAALINTYDGVMKGYMKRCFPAVANSLKPKRAGAKDVEEKNSLQFNIMVALFKAFNWFVIYFAMNYLGAAFVLLELQPAMNLYRSVYFVGHFVILFMIVLVKVMAILTPRAASAEKKKQ